MVAGNRTFQFQLASRARVDEICFCVGPTLDQCPVGFRHRHRVQVNVDPMLGHHKIIYVDQM